MLARWMFPSSWSTGDTSTPRNYYTVDDLVAMLWTFKRYRGGHPCGIKTDTPVASLPVISQPHS
jgi:hypothetical protein